MTNQTQTTPTNQNPKRPTCRTCRYSQPAPTPHPTPNHLGTCHTTPTPLLIKLDHPACHAYDPKEEQP